MFWPVIHQVQLSLIRGKSSTKGMCNSLQAAFSEKSFVSQLLLGNKLAKMRINEGDSVKSHIVAFENLLRQLKLELEKMEELDVLAQLFLTLPDKYDPLLTAIQNVDDEILSLSMVTERLCPKKQSVAIGITMKMLASRCKNSWNNNPVSFMKTEKFNNLGKIVFKLDSGSSEINVAKNSETIVARIVNPL